MQTKRLLIIALSLFIGVVGAMAQMTVKGVVISSEDQLPMPGVNIMVKGTAQGAVTDFDGNFILDVPQNAQLQFSFIGYKTLEVKSQSVMKVTMDPDAIQIQEVVALGYSSQKKAELSSAVVTLSAGNLTDVTTSDVGNMLQGKVAGLVVYNSTGQPGSTAEIRIRGTGSISADASPLYVVDGIAGGTFNPNDVESISVLKDAGATAIYGSAAAGGVIVVTTKSGKKNQKTRVNFKATAGMKQPLFGHFQMMNSEELYNTHKKIYSPSLFQALRPASLLQQDFNWQNAFFKNGVNQDYFVSVAGGSDKVSYYTSLDYYNEDGTLINTGFEKISARMNLNAQLYKNLDMNVRLAYNNSTTRESSDWTTLNDAYTKMPWDNPYDANGELVKITSATRPDNGKPWYSQDKWNALHNEQYNFAKSYNYGVVGDLQLNWRITDWLTATSQNRFDQSTYKYTQFIDPRTYSSSYSKGYLLNNVGMSKSFGTTEMLKAGHAIGLHTFNGIAGFEYSFWKTEYTSAAGIGMPNGMPALSACSVYEIDGYEVPGASWSVFAQFQYDYAKKYFVTASYRYDESSVFASEYRGGHFPSVAASWLVSNEGFLADNDVLTLLKLRASYGLTGNNNIGTYQYLGTYALTSSYQNNVAAIPSRLANQYLHWETAYMATVGVDINLGKYLEFSVDLYNTDNKDLLLYVKTAPSTGFFEKLDNVGSVRNQGIEFQATATPIKTKDWNWSIGFNIGFNKNKVTYTPDHEPFLQSVNSVSQQVKEGQDIYSWYMPKWMGVDPTNGDPLWEKIDLDADGNETGRSTTNNYNEASYQVVGKATPKFTGGLNTAVEYKGFFLNLNANFVYGNKIYNYNRMSLDSDGAYTGYNQMSIANNSLGWSRWENPGDNASHPKLVLNGNKSSNSVSSRYLEDGSFLRIKNITLGYNFPSKWLEKAKINSCRLYVTGDNLFTFCKFSGMDPEVSLRTSQYSLAGMYSDNYPVSRQFLFGFEIGF